MLSETVSIRYGSWLYLSVVEQINMLYPIDFKIQEGGKQGDPDELTQIGDSGECKQSIHL
ncbi:MAG: hypothetical protein RL248_857 [Pseudomonadota bacterium]|jgi:hypothetical protein